MSHGIVRHEHGNDELPTSRLRTVLLLTGGFLFVEFAGGLLSNSLALLSDAGHMLSDVAALGLALAAMSQLQRPPDPKRSFGYQRLEIVVALANGLLLLAAAAVIAYEAYRRIERPPHVEGPMMLAVAIAGLAVNVIALLLLRDPSRGSLGVRGAFLHVLGDAMGSVGAIVAGVVIARTGWTRIDAIVSFLIAALILVSSIHLLRESIHILLEGVPRHIRLPEVERALCEVEGVTGIHDLHVWRIGSHFDTLTVHLVVENLKDWSSRREAARRLLNDQFGIEHCTIEVEGPGEHRGIDCSGKVQVRDDSDC
ncbi:MAG: cation diffusion facilitator family transporter [Candidatus Eisenbacteria bacterium]|nr:cation diffusion facilitator family transporter [Candidatus Eisenbacteria bacterium]